MLGAIIGDIAGSVYEHNPIKTKDFILFSPESRFTDDTVLTVAIAAAVLSGQTYRETLYDFGNRYPDAGYGRSFRQWLATENPRPYNSYGNGSAMRVSPIGWAFASADEVIAAAKQSAEVTHDHPEGIRGACSVALAIYLARNIVRTNSTAPGENEKESMRNEIMQRFSYDLQRPVDDIRPGYRFDVSCQGSVPEAMICFFDAESFEDAIRNAISLGGDSDTQAAIAGAIAEAYYGIPETIYRQAVQYLPADLLEVVEKFYSIFDLPGRL